MKKLILIRHGETNKNLQKSLHAVNDTETLTDNGRKQIEDTAQKLRDILPDIVYSSKEKRALESAQILSQALDIPLRTIEGMQERNWGVFNGKAWEEVQKVLSSMTVQERYTYVPEGGESWRDFELRLIGAVERIVDDNKGESVVVVTHGGAIRALIPYLLNIPKEESFKYDPENASISIFEVYKNKFKAVVINDTAY